LVNRLFHQEHPFAQLVMQALGEPTRRLFQHWINLARLFPTRPRNVQQLAIGLF
jgi:hypothetical protein